VIIDVRLGPQDVRDLFFWARRYGLIDLEFRNDRRGPVGKVLVGGVLFVVGHRESFSRQHRQRIPTGHANSRAGYIESRKFTMRRTVTSGSSSRT
jgi:hypothetical protein